MSVNQFFQDNVGLHEESYSQAFLQSSRKFTTDKLHNWKKKLVIKPGV